jgi:hypothetical protein
VVADGCFVAHDLEDYVTKEKRTYFNAFLRSREVGQA